MFYATQCSSLMFTGQDEPDTIGPEGVEKLCKDLGVDPEDVRNFDIYSSQWPENVTSY